MNAGMNISVDTLQTFLKVADTLSVSRTADELGLGKSVVSKRVAQLESALQTTLFSRSTRKVALTASGEAYADHARRALAELSAAEERLRALRVDLSGRIRLTAPVSWGQRVLAKQLPEFLKRHPGIEIDLQLVDRMLDIPAERIDVALRWSSHTLAGYVCEPVASVSWLLAAAPAYLKDAEPIGAPADLCRHACLCYWRESSDEAWTLQRQHPGREEVVQVTVPSRYHVDNPEAVVDAAVAGLGIALVPHYLCLEAMRTGQLLPVLPEWTPQTKFGTVITATAAPDRMRLGRNQALLAFLREMK